MGNVLCAGCDYIELPYILGIWGRRYQTEPLYGFPRENNHGAMGRGELFIGLCTVWVAPTIAFDIDAYTCEEAKHYPQW